VPPAPELSIPAAAPPSPAETLRFPRKRWPWLAAAAAVLLLVGLPYGIYQTGLSRHQLALREARGHLTEVLDRYAEAHQHAQTEQEPLRRQARAKQLRLQILGPASYQPGVPSPYQVRTTDLDGHPRPARLSARLVAADGQVLFEDRELASSGDH